MSLFINPMGLTPDPILHQSMPDPFLVKAREYSGPPWSWQPDFVSLIRTPGSKTILDELDQLATAHGLQLMRPLNAAEMQQLGSFCDEWPEKWRGDRGRRLFFAGSVYFLSYRDDAAPEEEESLEIVPCAWFDGEWQFESLPLSAPLRADDVFPCVPFGMNASIPDCTIRPVRPGRRARGESRSASFRNRTEIEARAGLIPPSLV